MIEISISAADLFFPDPDTRVGFYVVIFTGVALPEDFVNGFATVAAKRFFIENDGIFPAIFPAVKTAYFNTGIYVSYVPMWLINQFNLFILK